MPEYARRLTEQGIEEFNNYLVAISEGQALELPQLLLTDERYSDVIEQDIEVDRIEFSTRHELGAYATKAIEGSETQALLGDQGFWSWLALYWFDQLCPADGKGVRKPSKPYNYILSRNYKHRPRHAIYMTWVLVSQYGDTSFFLLSKKPNERGELIEQLAARQYFIACEGIVKAASHLYYDPERKTFKRGSTSQKRKGNIRRFIAYLQQLDLTYDLGSLAGGTLLDLLPDEYAAFKEAAE